MDASPEQEVRWPELHRERRALVVVDMVESVRLMQAHEADVIDRWRRFVAEVRGQVLPAHGGRMVKSLGDGMLLEFAQVAPAAAAARQMQHRIAAHNVDRAADRAITLRIGIHLAEVVVDEFDIFGAGVNLTARIAALAQPGEVIVSAEVRDRLMPGVDGSIVDLGMCFLKHYEAPVRAFRVGEAPRAPPSRREIEGTSVMPRIIVLPAEAAAGDTGADAVICHELVAALSGCAYWHVISSLSTAGLIQRGQTPIEAARSARADFALTCVSHREGEQLRATLVLIDVVARARIWSTRATVEPALSAGGETGFATTIGAQVMQAVLGRTATIRHHASMPNLPSYSLLLQAVSLVHHTNADDVGLSRRLLEHLIDRHPRAAAGHAWLAKWHISQIMQKAPGVEAEFAGRARSSLSRALESEPEQPLALTLLGHLAMVFERDRAQARLLFEMALKVNPNESLAWLFLSYVHAAAGAHALAIDAVEHARALSPFDPMTALYDSFAAAAYCAAGQHERALLHAMHAVQLQRDHLPSLAQLIICQALGGRSAEAADTAHHYLALRPAASVARYLAGHPAADEAIARREADALRSAGIPP